MCNIFHFALNIIEKNLDLGKKMNREKMVRVRELNENH